MRPDRKLTIQARMVGGKDKRSSLEKRMGWLTVSKALEKSKKMQRTNLFVSNRLVTRCNMSTMAAVVDPEVR